jgi:hypothetical protein
MSKEVQGPLTLGKLAARLANLEEMQAQMGGSLCEVRLATGEGKLKQLARDEAGEEYARHAAEMQKLINDAVKILRVLIDSGAVTQEAVNAAVAPGT